MSIAQTMQAIQVHLPSTALLQTITQLIAGGQVRATIGSSFPLRDAALAHELSQRGHGRGRIVLHISA